MKATWQEACCAVAWLVLGAAQLGCGSSQSSSPSGSTCAYLDGTWMGNEIDSNTKILGPASVVIAGDQVSMDVTASAEALILTASCNDKVIPNQITSTITGGNHPEANGEPVYGIYELDKTTMSGMLAVHKPGMTTYPTSFQAESGIERVFVFQKVGSGTAGAGGSGNAACTGAGGVGGGTPTSGSLVAKAISVGGDHTCALLTDGTVRCWGWSTAGQLGAKASGIVSTEPIAACGISNAVAISAGASHSCALLSGGTVQCWGLNHEGQIGNGETSNVSVPTTVAGVSNAIAIATGGYHTCALLSGGTVQCWGKNAYGQLGNSSTESCGSSGTASSENSFACSTRPVAVAGITNATALTGGGDFTCALLADGTVKCWGENYYGQLGNDTTEQCTVTTSSSSHSDPCSTMPIAVSGIAGATAISAGYEDTCAVLAGGTVQCWGDNTYGQLGNSASSRSSPVVPVAISGITNAVGVSIGRANACALVADGTVECWGGGNLGDGNTAQSLVPVSVVGVANATAVSSGGDNSGDGNPNCVLLTGGKVQCWGAEPNGSGGLAVILTPTTVPGF